MWKSACRYLYCICIFGCLLGAVNAQSKFTVQAYFSPNTLSVDQVGHYAICIEGLDTIPSVQPPPIPGLDIQFIGKSHSLQVINGVKNAQVVLNYSVRAKDEGEYLVPSFGIMVDGQPVEVPGALLVVDNQKNESQTQAIDIHLDIKTDKSRYYYGEPIFVDVTLIMPMGLQCQILPPGKPLKVGDECIEDSTVDPVVQKSLGAIPTQKIIWSSRIKPIKSGTLNMHYELPILVYIQSIDSDWMKASMDDHIAKMFGILDVHQEKKILKTDPIHLDIQPLPEGPPGIFSGDIGSFEVEILPNQQEVATLGEPIVMSMRVSGKGELAYMQAPKLLSTAQYKVYPPRSKIEMSGRETMKLFEYVVIPQQVGLLKLPSLEIAWFDPAKDSYQVKTIQFEPIEVQGNPVSIVSPQSEPTPNSIPLIEDAPIVTTHDNTSKNLLVGSSWLMVAFICIVGGVMYYHFRKKKSVILDKHSIITNCINSSLVEAKKATLSHDIESFLNNTHKTLQEIIGLKLVIFKEYETYEEIIQCPELPSTLQDILSEISFFVELRNAMHFGKMEQRVIDYTLLYERWDALLKQLKDRIDEK